MNFYEIIRVVNNKENPQKEGSVNFRRNAFVYSTTTIFSKDFDGKNVSFLFNKHFLRVEIVCVKIIFEYYSVLFQNNLKLSIPSMQMNDFYSEKL